jgi:hypothetical protein
MALYWWRDMTGAEMMIAKLLGIDPKQIVALVTDIQRVAVEAANKIAEIEARLAAIEKSLNISSVKAIDHD